MQKNFSTTQQFGVALFWRQEASVIFYPPLTSEAMQEFFFHFLKIQYSTNAKVVKIFY